MNELSAYLRTIGRVAEIMQVVYEVELLDPGARSYETDHRRVGRPPAGYDADWARAYWRGDFLPPLDGARCAEILTLSPLQIVRRVE